MIISSMAVVWRSTFTLPAKLVIIEMGANNTYNRRNQKNDFDRKKKLFQNKQDKSNAKNNDWQE